MLGTAAWWLAWVAGMALAGVLIGWVYGAGLVDVRRTAWAPVRLPVLPARGWIVAAAKLRRSLRQRRTAAWGWSGWRGAWVAGTVGALMSVLGWFAHRRLVRGLRDAAASSAATLDLILRLNASTAFGEQHHFASLLLDPPSSFTSSSSSSSSSRVSAFKRAVPLARYDDMAPWVARIVKGEQNVLTSEPILQLGVTSGTSYSRKQLPVTRRQKTNFFMQGIAPLFHVLFTHFPHARGLQKSLKVMFQPTYSFTEGGIKVGANSSAPSDSKALLHFYTTPPIAYEIKSEPDLLYVHILFALKDEHIGTLEANFIMLIHHLFVRMERQWRQLAQDIERGTISEDLQLDQHIRTQLNQSMGGPDVPRARELEKEFEAGFEGIARRIWPYLNLVLSVATGSFALYAERARYYLGDVPIYSPLYAATEGLLGINLDPSQSMYYLVPTNMFIEFIELENSDQEQPETLTMDEVEAGKEYELAVTSTWGLYRYRMGDVVRVVDFYQDAESIKRKTRGAPLIEFGYRLGQLLNVRGEKTSEQAMFQALTSSLTRWREEGLPGSLVDYCCIDPALSQRFFEESQSAITLEGIPHYDVFVELTEEDADTQHWERRAAILDEELCQSNPIYRSFRVKNGIGGVIVYQVRAGTFDKLRQLIVNAGTSPNQIKVPRVLQDAAQLECLRHGLM